MWKIKFAQIHQIESNLWAIDEIGKTIMYVYEGSRRVLLLDTGFGLLDLKALVNELCPGKEIIVINTHAHGDHNSGNGQFECVYCGRLDEPFNHEQISDADRANFAANFFNGNPRAEGACAEDWHPAPARRVLPLDDGDIIDLGGIKLEVLETPGHSLGSICLFDHENSYLFTGDMALTWQVWGQLSTSSALRYYADSLRLMADTGAQHVFPAHGVPDNPCGCPIWELPARALEIYAQGTQDIVDGKTTGEPFETFAGNGLCKLFEIGGMVYDPDRIGI